MKKLIRSYIVPNSLLFQLLSRSLLVMAILLAVIGLFQYLFMREVTYSNRASSIRNQILSAPPDLWEEAVRSVESNIPGRFPVFFMPDTRISFIDAQGNFLDLPNDLADHQLGNTPQLTKEDYQKALSSKQKLTYKVVNQPDVGEQLVVLQPIGNKFHNTGLIQVSLSTKPLKDGLIRQLLIFMTLAFLALIAGMFALISVLRKTLEPLSNMTKTVEKINAGNLQERFPPEQGQVEIDRLAFSFNGMLERLETSFEAEKEAKEQMRRFVADASHELRTPLTSIHGFLEVLLRGAMNQPDKLDKSLRSMLTESERMKKLVQDLLLLAKLDRSPTINPEEGDVEVLIKEMEPQLRLLAGNRTVNLRLTAPARCWFDEDKLKQIILNLFHNAVQHTDANKGQINITLEPMNGGLELVVRDNGPGIGKEHLPHLFNRFYRSDPSRTRKYGGAGLGLAITKTIVELHGGLIRVESSPGEGSAFYVWIPVRPATANAIK
ncbi:sensor histidine kinase [Desulfosporosinus youngiae]|uniref:histidine kinase n=1 Tax=Desulfosporosinus youngiae DSM 17734 TaxID=768710 RepID=H5XXI0_9FIRM|nr:HAMP domain-containing sensor histidine kinase [Desulfosporosinus youngiae]EHQ91186.1 signal transduction histidine kinase [Desulfosporosinus youngiae DSM 17734]